MTYKEQLGFLPLPRYIYVIPSGKCCWRCVEGEFLVPVPFHQLRGYLVEVNLVDVKWNDKPCVNLQLVLDCGSETYIVSSREDTVFSRQVVSTMLNLESLEFPITISVRPGEKGTVFGSVWINRERVPSSYESNIHLSQYLHLLREKFPTLFKDRTDSG